jgi:hypothetical protein
MRNAITWVDETDITDRLLDPGEITSGMIQRMAGYLARKRGDRPLSSRADIDPTEIREFLPYVVLVDIQDDPLRVYYRLVGTRIAEFYGEFTGTWMHDRPISDAYRKVAERIYRASDRNQGAGLRHHRNAHAIRRDGLVRVGLFSAIERRNQRDRRAGDRIARPPRDRRCARSRQHVRPARLAFAWSFILLNCEWSRYLGGTKVNVRRLVRSSCLIL